MKESIVDDSSQTSEMLNTSRLPAWMTTWALILLLGIFGIALHLINVHSLTNWDEGWYINVAQRMLKTGEWFVPIYYEDSAEKYVLFDKPPFVFWLGAISMWLFGYTDLGAKFPMIFFSGLLGVWAFLLFDHKRYRQPHYRIVGIMASLFVSLCGFSNLYGRTAYIDPIITSLGALTCVLGVRAIDYFFWGNRTKAYCYLISAGIINAMVIFAKAWQGLIFAPALALYFCFTALTMYCDFQTVKNIIQRIKRIPKGISATKKPEILGLIASIACFLLIQLSDVTFKFYGINYFAIISALTVCYACKQMTAIFDYQRHYIIMSVTMLGVGSVTAFVATKIVNFFVSNYLVAMTAITERAVFMDLGKETITIICFIVALISEIIVVFVLSLLIGGMILHDTDAQAFIKEIVIPLIPLCIIGGWIVLWGWSFIIQGTLFDRNAGNVIGFGLGGLLISGSIVLLTQKFWVRLITQMKDATNYATTKISTTELRHYIYFMIIALGVAIISFFPFLSWLNWIDSRLPYLGMTIRIPGELFGEGAAITSYEWLFFDYYLGWRYTNTTSYTLYDSINAFTEPFFIITIPLMLLGIYSLYKEKNYNLLILLVSYFFSVLLVFFPAAFQLNYYYLPAFIPSLILAGVGASHLIRQPVVQIRDKIEVILISIPFFALISNLFILPFFKPIAASLTLNDQFLFIVGFLVCTTLFVALVRYFGHSIIDILVITGILYYFIRYFYLGKWSEQDWVFNSIAIGLLVLIFGLSYYLYQTDANLRLAFAQHTYQTLVSSIVLIGLLLLGGVAALSNGVYYNSVYEPKFEKIAYFINSHGGNYNNSTYVFPEAGACYALSYYLEHTVIQSSATFSAPIRHAPAFFMYNTNSSMESIFLKINHYIQFFVVLVDEYYISPDIVPEGNYTVSFLWLTTHYTDYTKTIGDLPWYLRVYANATLVNNYL